MRDYLAARPKGAARRALVLVRRSRPRSDRRTRAVRSLPAALLGPEEARLDERPNSSSWQGSSTRLDDLGRAIAAPPFPPPMPTRRRPPPRRAADRVLAGVVGRAPGPAGARCSSARTTSSLQWGGPNADNVYRHARVDPSLHVPDRRADALVRGLHPRRPRNFMHMEGSGTIAELSAHRHRHRRRATTSRSCSAATATSPTAYRSPTGALVGVDPRVLLRLAAARAGDLHHRMPRRRLAAEAVHSRRVRHGLEEAATHLQRSLTYWNQYMLDARAEQTDNEFGGGYDVPRGLRPRRSTRSASSTSRPTRRWSSTATCPTAATGASTSTTSRGGRRWSTRHASPRSTTRRRASAPTAACRIVVAHEDPGVPNWLDTEGRREALLTLAVVLGRAATRRCRRRAS